MSGTSLDGLDIAFCQFSETNSQRFEILYAQTAPYSAAWQARLKALPQSDAFTFALTDREFGAYLGQAIKRFCQKYEVKPQFVASHGHTIFHQPAKALTVQIGHGAAIAAACGLPVVCDFRSLDVALGGQGAPLVPIGDALLFGQYTFCLNLGGIANISFQQHSTNKRIAFDICPVNMVLNAWAERLGKAYDKDGLWAAEGQVNADLLAKLNALDFYKKSYPKSLGREWVETTVLPLLEAANLSEKDILATCSAHIAEQIAAVIKAADVLPTTSPKTVLVTGGGTFNKHLISQLQEKLTDTAQVIVPNEKLINYKEALIFAFLGKLRAEEKVNCLRSVTGASADNIGGAVYLSR
ncbi:anhydro-N-acetylmuramic acid kinase [Flexibacter flexilis DSM 6793]|uniref:Anhydro-N-acetylmuramic acid kinase n=2 Tax=Flexibacter flexilis TaxID=998 RepID=A0A1I1JY00_9BACT|nr:anhydro-N-acetylmuramic acid kinase [Flexibacter flexilis DSM 6793]